MPRNVRAVLLLVVCLAGLACVTPRPGSVNATSKPGWGRGYSAEEERTTVRAVPAAAKPSAPITPTGKPGWGRE